MANGAPKGKAAASAAARAEHTDTPLEGDFRGITLKLPSKLPAACALDLAEMQASQDNPIVGLGVLWRFLTAIVGGEQLASIRQKIADDGDDIDSVKDLIEEMVQAVTNPYALTPGESSASATP